MGSIRAECVRTAFRWPCQWVLVELFMGSIIGNVPFPFTYAVLRALFSPRIFGSVPLELPLPLHIYWIQELFYTEQAVT